MGLDIFSKFMKMFKSGFHISTAGKVRILFPPVIDTRLLVAEMLSLSHFCLSKYEDYDQGKKNETPYGGHILVKSEPILKKLHEVWNHKRISNNLRLCATILIYLFRSYDENIIFVPFRKSWKFLL